MYRFLLHISSTFFAQAKKIHFFAAIFLLILPALNLASADKKGKNENPSLFARFRNKLPSAPSIAYPVTISETAKQTLENGIDKLTKMVDQLTKGSNQFYELINIQTNLNATSDKITKFIEKQDKQAQQQTIMNEGDIIEESERKQLSEGTPTHSRGSSNSLQAPDKKDNVADQSPKSSSGEQKRAAEKPNEKDQEMKAQNEQQQATQELHLSLTPALSLAQPPKEQTPEITLGDIIKETTTSLDDLHQKLIKIYRNDDEDTSLKIPELKDAQELLKKLDAFADQLKKKKEAILKTITESKPELDIAKTVKQEIENLKKECAQVIKTFKESTLSGLYGALEQAIDRLGIVLNDVVTKLSNSLSHQLKVQLLEVVGFPAIIKIDKEISDLIEQLLQRKFSINARKFGFVLQGWKDQITQIITIIKNNDDDSKTQLQILLETLITNFDKVHKQCNSQDQEIALDKKDTAIILRQLQIHIQKIMNTNGGMLTALETNLNSMGIIFKEFTQDMKKIIKEDFPQASDRVFKSGFSYFKRGVLFVSSMAVSAASIVFLMKNWDKPAARKAGLVTMAGSLVYPMAEGAYGLWGRFFGKKT